MTEDQPTRQQLIDQILYGSAGLKAAEEAIQSALKTFVDATAQEVVTLVKNNVQHSELQTTLQQDEAELEKNLDELLHDHQVT